MFKDGADSYCLFRTLIVGRHYQSSVAILVLRVESAHVVIFKDECVQVRVLRDSSRIVALG